MPVLEQAGYEVIAPNLPGANRTRVLSSWAGRILELLPGDFIPVGISMGGYLAFELWRQAPKRIPAMVLADTRANADDEAWPGGAGRDHSPPPRRGLRRLLGGPRAEALLGRRVRGGRRAARGDRRRAVRSRTWSPPSRRCETGPTRRPPSRDIDVPALVLVGEEDALTPPVAAKEIVAGLAHGRYAEIPGAGHLSPLEQPAEFNEEVHSLPA